MWRILLYKEEFYLEFLLEVGNGFAFVARSSEFIYHDRTQKLPDENLPGGIFVDGPLAHVDIAGTAWNDTAYGINPVGASGRW